MLIKFFRNGKGAGAGPVGYLVADKVLAYDDNRDLIRDADGQPMTVTREPLPEVLRGNPDRTEALIDASRHQWTYRAGVISFAATDAPTEEQQSEVMDHFERLAFAGLDPTQYEVLWVRHTHEDRVELHFCTPRLELTSGRSLNIAPPGKQLVDALEGQTRKFSRACGLITLRLGDIQGGLSAQHVRLGAQQLGAIFAVINPSHKPACFDDIALGHQNLGHPSGVFRGDLDRLTLNSTVRLHDSFG